MQYAKHVSGFDPREPPKLDVEATGVPALRRLLYKVPARGKATTLSRIGTSVLPGLYQGVIATLTKSRLERKQDVLTLMECILDGLPSIPNASARDIREKFDQYVTKVFSK